MPLTIDLHKDEEAGPAHAHSNMSIRDYQSKVGSLQWAASTVRLDISLACSKLSQANRNPTQVYTDQLGRALKYFCDTRHFHILYHVPRPTETGSFHNILYAFTDATWNTTKGQGKSQSGFITYLNGGPISWASKRQASASMSSFESETIATVTCAQECISLRRQLHDLGFPQPKPTNIYTDNKSLVEMMANAQQPDRSRAVHRIYWLKHQVSMHLVKLVYCPGRINPADYLTKTIANRSEYEKLRKLSKILAWDSSSARPTEAPIGPEFNE